MGAVITKKKGGGGILPDNAPVTITITAGEARALLANLTTAAPLDPVVAKKIALKITQALASGGGGKKKK
jgi:hypothetical protein